MGYSIAAHAINAKAQLRMAEFMRQNYRTNMQIFKHGPYSRFATNSDDKEYGLSYDSNKLAIGFDYNACEPERNYIFAVCRWMTLKIGHRRTFTGLGLAPVFYYDGGHCKDDRWPVLIDTEWESKVPDKWDWCLVSKTGFISLANEYKSTPLWDSLDEKGRKNYIARASRNMKALCGFNFSEIDKSIKTELDRLEDLWVKSTL